MRRFPYSRKYCYSDCTFVLTKIDGNGTYHYVGGGMKRDKENWIVEDCEAGEYMVGIKTPWISFVNESSFSIYGPKKVVIHKLEKEQIPKNFIRDLFLSHSNQHDH